jgi:DUF4097 and DUF4098 domain-containing protein YvlB
VGITSQSGSIRVGTSAEADLRTVSGHVELQRCDGRCRVFTKSGRIAVGDTREADISTTSGSVAIDRVIGTVQVRSVSGRVSVGSSAGGPVTASTVSGTITIRLPPAVRPSVHSAGRGTLKSGFPPGDDVEVHIATVSGRAELVAG